jgi:hypothetical protein
MYLVQDFHLDASRLSGLVGFWTVELPVESRMVPEPNTLPTLSLTSLALIIRRRKLNTPEARDENRRARSQSAHH